MVFGPPGCKQKQQQIEAQQPSAGNPIPLRGSLSSINFLLLQQLKSKGNVLEITMILWVSIHMGVSKNMGNPLNNPLKK